MPVPPARASATWCLVVALALAPANPGLTQPQWWSNRGVIDIYAPANDFGPANVGQLKHFASKARDEFEARIPNGAGAAIDALVDGWYYPTTGQPLTPDPPEENYAPINLGQLKAVAKPFYDRLIDLGLLPAGAYPWTATADDDANYAPANLGQLKNVFNIDVLALVAAATLDTDNDGMPDTWEIAHGLDPNNPADASGDADGDGLTNLDEFQLGTKPDNVDSDADGSSDANDLAPNDRNSNDPDGDGLNDGQEEALGADRLKADTDGDGLIDPLDAVPWDEVIAFPTVANPTYAMLPVVLPDPDLLPTALDNRGRVLAASTKALKLIDGATVTDVHVNGTAQSSLNPQLKGFAGDGTVLFYVDGTADLEAELSGYWVFRSGAAGTTISQLEVPLPLLFERFSSEGDVLNDMEPSTLAHIGMAFPYHPVIHFLGGDGSVRGHQFVYYNPPSDPPYNPPLPWDPIRRYDELHHNFTWTAASNLPQTSMSSTQVQWPNGVWADATIAPVTQYYLGNDAATLAARIVQTHEFDEVEVPGYAEYLEFEGTGIEVFLGDQLLSSGATSQFAAPVWINDMPDIHVLGVRMSGSVPEAEIWRKVNGVFASTRLLDGLVNGTELAFDELPFGTGPLYLPEPDEDTSYNPVVQGRTYLKLNDRGEVVLGKTSGLWRNGKRESLDELSALIGGNEIVSAPGTQPLVRKYQLTELLDLNDSGVMLARYRIYPENVDGGYVLLVPIELVDTKDKVLDDQVPQGTMITQAMRDVNIEPKATVDEQKERSIAWIATHGADDGSNAPDMPQLVHRFRGTEPMGLKIKWKLEVIYDRPRGTNPNEAQIKSQDEVFVPKKAGGNQPWKEEALDGAVEIFDHPDWIAELQEKGFFGGEAKLAYQLLKADGSALGPETIMLFSIGGKNPEDDLAKDYIDAQATAADSRLVRLSYAVGRHESKGYNGTDSRYNQFWEGYARRFHVDHRRGDPLWCKSPKEKSAGGFGIFQITGNLSSQFAIIPREQMWNWRKNVDAYITMVKTGGTAAKGSVMDRFIAAVARTYPSDNEAQNPPTNYAYDGGTYDAWEMGTITLYNGAGGYPPRFLKNAAGKITKLWNPWNYETSRPSGSRWRYYPNDNNYLHEVIQQR